MRSRPDGREAPSDRAWHARPGLGSRRVRLVAFGVSLAAHLIVLVLYPSVVGVLSPESAAFPLPSAPGPPQGAIVLRLIEIDEALDAERPEDPDDIEEVEAPVAAVEAPVIVSIPTGSLVPPAPTAAELLRPNLEDARLWAELPAELFDLTMEEREELLLSASIVAWYDSLALAGAAEDRLTDWTFRDSKGGRWGISEGKIHLGDITLPLPLNFGVPVGKRDEIARRMFEWDEINRQSQRYLIEQSWKERAAAIRARRDRERALARGDTIGGR